MKKKKPNKESNIISKKALKRIASQINRGGATYGPLLDKNYAGTPNIAISPFPELSQIVKGRVTTAMLRKYCKKNIDLLSEYFSVAGWFNKAQSQTYLDISVPISLEKESEAVALGKDSNQISGFNLFNFSEVPLGGTGKFNSKVAPFENRLKTALALMNK